MLSLHKLVITALLIYYDSWVRKLNIGKWPDIGNRPKYPSYIKGEFKSPQPYPTRKFNCQTKPNQKCKIPTHGSFETLRFFSLTRIQVFYNSVYIFYSYL